MTRFILAMTAVATLAGTPALAASGVVPVLAQNFDRGTQVAQNYDRGTEKFAQNYDRGTGKFAQNYDRGTEKFAQNYDRGTGRAAGGVA